MFSAIFVISLARTPERLAEFRRRWPKELGEPTLFPAHDGVANPPPETWFELKKYRSTVQARFGAWGCLQSHIGVLTKAVDMRVSRALSYGVHAGNPLWKLPILVCEDDCLIEHPDRIEPFLKSLPEAWQLAYLGCQHEKPPIDLGNGLLKVGGAGRTHAYIVHPSFIEELIRIFEEADFHADWALRECAWKYRFYAPAVNIASQMENESTIIGSRVEKRVWNHSRKSPLVLLDCPREVADRLRAEGMIHTGYNRNKDTGVDHCLENLAFNILTKGGELEGLGRLGLVNWVYGSPTECGIMTECNMLERAACAVWCPNMPEISQTIIRQMFENIVTVTGRDYEFCRGQLNQILGCSNAPRPPGEKVFVHSGKLGDIIYSFPTIKACGGGKLIIVPNPGMTGSDMPDALIDSLRPLALSTGYISSVERMTDVSGPVVNLNAWRYGHKEGRNIAQFHLGKFGKDIGLASVPWLDVEPRRVARVVFARSLVEEARRKKDPFPWGRASYAYWKDCCFVGTGGEYADFLATTANCSCPRPRFFSSPNLLDLASVIAGADLVVANQSCPLAIAHALGKRVIVEQWIDNCFFDVPGSVYDMDGTVKFPDL